MSATYTVAQCDEVLEKLRQAAVKIGSKSTLQVQMPDGVFVSYTNPARINASIQFWEGQRKRALDRSGQYNRQRLRVCG